MNSTTTTLADAKGAADLLYANLRSESGCQHLCEFLLSDPSNNDVPVENDENSPEIKIMICRSDPVFHQPGTAAFSSSLVETEMGPYDQNLNPLVNDLDMWVEGPTGIIHRPWILDPASPLTAAREAQDTGTHYGYALFTDTTDRGTTNLATAWEGEPGQPIVAGAIPEPSSSMITLLGSFLLLRRKR